MDMCIMSTHVHLAFIQVEKVVKKTRHPNKPCFWILILLFSTLTACQSQQPAQLNTSVSSITVVTDNNYPPYVFMNEDGDLQGILVDQWALWEENTGVNVELIGLPWAEALHRMQAGEFDVIDTIFYTEERAKVFDYSPPYAEINVRIFFRKNISGIANEQNLKGFRVAVKDGDANVEYLLEKGITSLVY